MNRRTLSQIERDAVVDALRHNGSIVEAANELGVSRRVLKTKIIKHRIEWPMSRPEGEATVGA